MPRVLTSASLRLRPSALAMPFAMCAASRQTYGASSTEIAGTQEPNVAAPSV